MSLSLLLLSSMFNTISGYCIHEQTWVSKDGQEF